MNQRFLDFQRLVEHELRNLKLPAEPKNLYAPIDYFLDLGGKRIRPVLTLFGAALFDEHPEQALPQAAAIEVFHNFTLVHDDIMDRADLRRGQQTVHKKWDDNIAILSGDAMMVKAYQMMVDAPVDRIPALLKVFSDTAMEVCEGQKLDMDFANKAALAEAEYLEMIRLKTAVLLSAALRIGALRVGAKVETLQKLDEFAINMGLAFQVRDDYLDAFGNAEQTGKQVGGDIREGKRTWMTVKALEIATVEQQKLLQEAYAMNDLEARVQHVLKLYNAMSIPALTLKVIEGFSERSLTALDEIDGNESVKKDLRALVEFLIARSS